MISYAQNGEDVVLARAFAGRRTGFYIDVGAADPDNHSVTRHFYELGWRGINIDPLPAWHEMLERARPEDINLLVGVSDEPGEMTLEVGAEHPGGATFIREHAGAYRNQGMRMSTVTSRLVTLAEVCEQHVGDREIDFLKIDAEGFELRAIRGGDWDRWRPRVVVVEATEPNAPVPNHQEWEPLLLEAGYGFALFDGLNRFYVRREDAELSPVLAAPANVFDDFVRAKETDAQRAPATAAAPPPSRNYAFYGEGMSPGRGGIVMLPLRRLLRRVQRPWIYRQVEIFNELRAAIDAQEAQLDDVRRLIGELRVAVEQQEARSWDQTAIARRLAALEDSLVEPTADVDTDIPQ